MARKESKICLVCGNEFKGTYGKFTCNSTCRSAMSRMVEIGKKPEYWLIAQSKGQKMPSFKKRIKSIKQVEIKVPEIVPEKLTPIEPPKIMTLEEKFQHNSSIDAKIKIEKDRHLTPGMHPRAFRLQQDELISELEKQKV